MDHSLLHRSHAEALDRRDVLAHARARFNIPSKLIYLDGNSLGPLPSDCAERLTRVVEKQWGNWLISGWNRGWMAAQTEAAEKLARLLGAEPHEVVVCDSTSVNLFKVAVAAARLKPDRSVIVTTDDNFPSDLYILQSAAELLGLTVRTVDPAEVLSAIDDTVAVVSITHVDYRTGAAHDMAGITTAAHDAEAIMVWDLAHSAGVFDLKLSRLGVDLAVGCGYKYLNGGPGAPAFVYANERLHDRLRQPLTGWLGHRDPFAFEAGYDPSPGVRRLVSGTPPVLATTALDAGLDTYSMVTLPMIRAKAMALTDYFIDLVDARLAPYGLEVVSPRDPERRGAQVSLRHDHAYEIVQAAIARNVVGDFRAPNLARFGFAPLYVSFGDVYDAVEQLVNVMAKAEWQMPEFAVRHGVT
ncbi:MAG: kynureninase [Acidimicrobiia bacterium]